MLAKLVVEGTTSASRLRLARRMAADLACAAGLRHPVVAGGLCREGTEETGSRGHLDHPAAKYAALHDLPPQRTGRRGRPGRRERFPCLDGLAAPGVHRVTVTRYGTTVTVQAAALTCLCTPYSAPATSR